MRRFLVIFLISLLTLSFAEFVVYTYDSMISGLAKEVAPLFEKLYGVKVKFVSFGDAGKTLSRLIIEKEKTKADVILGLDQTLLLKALQADLLIQYKPINYTKIRKDLRPKEYFATPFDYGSIAVVYNTEKIEDPPRSFEDLLNPKYRRKIVVEDPRTSSTGLSFLLWTIAVYGEDGFKEYWKKLSKNLLTITAGWDEAFEMLENGEADMMVSYLTDGAYSYYYYKSAKFLPTVMKEGMFVQTEYVGIVKYTDDLELAKRFIEFMISDFVQEKIPLNQWMLPVSDVKLPEVFEKYVPKVEKILTLDPNKVSENLDRWIEEWEEAVGM
jgi:thiamine transport system substrate-binding protein